MNLADLIAEEEERMLAESRAQIAAEKAAYDALPQEEKDRIIAEREARWEEMLADADENAVDEDEDEDEDND